MGRPALNPSFKAARLASARAEAQRLNKRLPPLVNAFARPSGKVYIRYEPTGGRKVILRSTFDSPQFYEELAAAKSGLPVPPTLHVPPIAQAEGTKPGTWRSLCEAYFVSDTFLRHPEGVRRVRQNLLRRTWPEPLDRNDPDRARFGNMPLHKFEYDAVRTLRDRFARISETSDVMDPTRRTWNRRAPTKPEAGNSVVRVIRAVFEWAKEYQSGLVGGRNPARQVKLYPSSTGGWRTWGPEQCAAFEARHAPGTKARLVYDLAIFTGQRLADVARLGPSMIDLDRKGRERMTFVQTKNRNSNPVTAYVPVVPELHAALSAARASGVLGNDSFICTSAGGKYNEQSLGNFFRRCCKEAGLSGYSMHGLRKTGVVNLIRANCTVFEIMSITGHRSRKEIERYGREFMRGTAMEGAFDKWLALPGSEPAPGDPQVQAA